jgi:uncharacterized protein (TIGR02217 family)
VGIPGGGAAISNNVFPSLPGLRWNQKKTPIFSTRIQKAASGKEIRLALMVYPLYEFVLAYDILRNSTLHDELRTLVGFYLSRQGATDSFLYIDPSDNLANNQVFGTGGNNATVFYLGRTYGGFFEYRKDIQTPGNNAAPFFRVYVNGNLANNYTVNYLDSGTVTFNSAPANNAVISADFSFYYRVRFVEYGEGAEAFDNFMKDLWQAQSVSFISAR